MSTRPGSSSGGSVSGGQARLVTPPGTAASISDSSVALYSWPGSRSRAERSMKPGETTRPFASITRSAFSPFPSEIFPSTTHTSPTASRPLAGSITRPPFIWSFTLVPGDDAHDCHSYRDAEGDLRQDHGVWAVGDRRVDFDAAVHRAGMHHDRVALRERELLGRGPVVLEEFLRRGQERAAHALVLQAQHDDDVGAAQAFAHVVEHAHAHRFDAGRRQSLRRDHAHFGCAERGGAVDQRARPAPMRSVADS